VIGAAIVGLAIGYLAGRIHGRRIERRCWLPAPPMIRSSSAAEVLRRKSATPDHLRLVTRRDDDAA